MEVGTTAHRLLLQLKSDMQAPPGQVLPPSDDLALGQLARECAWLVDRNLQLVASLGGAAPGDENRVVLYVQHTAAHRCKRAGLVYLCDARSMCVTLSPAGARAPTGYETSCGERGS